MMDMLVDYTLAVDDRVRIPLEPDGGGVVAEGVKLSSNLPHGITLEAALG